jgi:hypothetical protein
MKNRSTLEYASFVLNSIEEGWQVDVYTDFLKAFDRVRHQLLETKLEGAHQTIKKLIPHIMGLGPENTLADPPNDSFINPQIWRGGLRISFMRGAP